VPKWNRKNFSEKFLIFFFFWTWARHISEESSTFRLHLSANHPSCVMNKLCVKTVNSNNSFIDTNLIHDFYINYIKLISSTCFERHPLIFRRSMMLIVHVCSLWYSHCVKVNYCFIVLGICYHFVKKETLTKR